MQEFQHKHNDQHCYWDNFDFVVDSPLFLSALSLEKNNTILF